MKVKITTDWHIAARRTAGTTPASQAELKMYLRDSLANQLDDTDHLICGDLFDQFTIPADELISTYYIFASWLARTGRNLALLRGNHDFSMRGEQKSSFDVLGVILSEQFPKQVTIAKEVTEWKQFVLVPHLPNQEILNIEIEKLNGVRGKVIVFHANVDNPFAEDNPHSLNLLTEQLKELVSRDNIIVCGHEHQHRSLLNGRCVVLGNTVPSSIADCLGNDRKVFALFSGTDYELIPSWDADGVYAEADWQHLADTPADLKFIRVAGKATAEQAAEVVGAIDGLRRTHSAFVISNAVSIEGISEFGELTSVTFEDVTKFDVMGLLMEEFSDKERDVLRSLL